MGDPRNLSFSTTFNQQKILINDSRTITIPQSAGITPDLLFTVATGLSYAPTYRAFYEMSGQLFPIWRQPSSFQTGISDPSPKNCTILSGFNSLNSFFIKTLNFDPAITNVTFYYRIYIDSSPS